MDTLRGAETWVHAVTAAFDLITGQIADHQGKSRGTHGEPSLRVPYDLHLVKGQRRPVE